MMARMLVPPDLLEDPDEVARLRSMTDDERAAVLVGVMRAAAALLAANDNRERVLFMREERTPAALATWARLQAARARRRG